MLLDFVKIIFLSQKSFTFEAAECDHFGPDHCDS
jgi:hypothetical protein